MSYVEQAALEFAVILYPLPPRCWDYKYVPPWPAPLTVYFKEAFGLGMVAHAFNLAPQGQKQVDLSESQTSLLDIGEFQASRGCIVRSFLKQIKPQTKQAKDIGGLVRWLRSSSSQPS